jgi:LAO/AO transport system kinase
VEMADLVAINKADGENKMRAELARQDQDSALHYLQPATHGWKTEVMLCAGLTGVGVPELWERIGKFYAELEPKGIIARRRQEQSLSWLDAMVEEELKRRFYADPRVTAQLPALRQALLRGEITAVRAAETILSATSTAGFAGLNT